MKNTPRPAIDPKLVKELIDAGNDAMCESINLDLAVGNDDFDDVNYLQAALDRLSDALEKIESAGYSFFLLRREPTEGSSVCNLALVHRA